MGERKRRLLHEVAIRERLVVHALEGRLTGAPGTVLWDAKPGSLADAAATRKVADTILRELDGGMQVILSDAPAISPSEAAKAWFEMETPGGPVMGAIVMAQASQPVSPFRAAGGRGETVMMDDRLYFRANPDRCTRIRAALSVEHEGIELPEPGAEFRVAVVNIHQEHGLRARWLYRVRPAAERIDYDLVSAGILTHHILEMSGLSGLGEEGTNILRLALSLSETRLGRSEISQA